MRASDLLGRSALTRTMPCMRNSSGRFGMAEVRRVRPNEEEVVAKLMDGEAIIINLVTGVYYSMEGAGASIWAMIEAGDAVDTIVSTLASECAIPRQRASEDVD